jgi:hypothetical protein
MEPSRRALARAAAKTRHGRQLSGERLGPKFEDAEKASLRRSLTVRAVPIKPAAAVGIIRSDRGTK